MTRPLVMLMHGGFWQAAYDARLMDALDEDLRQDGWRTRNIEYRRLGNGGGWPATFDDLLAEVDAVGSASVVTVGHSAGGQLALWAAAERGLAGAVSQAGVLDLRGAATNRVGRDTVQRLLGGMPDAVPERYAAASPLERVPLGLPQLVVHGDRDDTVPVAMSRAYVEAGRAAGDVVEYVELAGVGHYEHIDPSSTAWAAVRAWLDARWG
ncbi:MAG TPA: alpha/beta hydrolase [Candidatus Limnocylindria bacterium]|nr:alpha/beta hydrolase [Candidatus Limnocylindria bacterium]